MSRILALQRLDAGTHFLDTDDDPAGLASTCSFGLCGGCSSNSAYGCPPPPLFVAI